MERIIKILLILSLAVLITGCKKDNAGAGQNNNSRPTISNLNYYPSTIAIIEPGLNFDISGTIDFTNASRGVSTFRLTTSTGADLTATVPANTETSGTLSGLFQVAFPADPGVFTFQIWIIDNGGNVSNKLQGTVQTLINDSGSNWLTIFQQWPLFKIIRTNQRFMAVGGSGAIAVSTEDGHYWTALNSGSTASLNGLVWTGTQYIAVGATNTILSSTDGNTWTPRFLSPGADIWFYSVAWSGNGFVAAGIDYQNNQTAIFNSPDGITWTNNHFAVPGGNINAVAWANHQYIAVGKVTGKPLILTSPNGLDWTDRSPSILFGKGIELNDVTWDGNKYVAVGFGLTATSEEGLNWIVNDEISWGATGVVWSGKKLMATGIDGFYNSTDGLHWTKNFDVPAPLRSIAWSGYQYAAVGFITSIILVSPSPF
jgi:hypothetical protein